MNTTEIGLATTKTDRKSHYEDLITREMVAVTFPKNSDFVPEHSFGDPPFVVPAHYHRGVSFGRTPSYRPLWVNINYFGFDPEQVGRNVSAKITIQKKITEEAGAKYEFLIINIFRDENKERLASKFRLKIGVTRDAIKERPDEGALIPETGTERTGRFVWFERIVGN